MQMGKRLGKIALAWGVNHVVPVIQPRMCASKLDSDGICLLVGRLSGLGRSPLSMLVRIDARKLCFLSRSGARSTKAKDLIQKLEQQQVRVQVQTCDVSDESALTSAVDCCTRELGKIHGVFQCTMLLRDGLFANMTHRQWVESTQPKAQGSWNLHKHLSDDMDFFIPLSSFTATFGRRNYAAAGRMKMRSPYHRRVRGWHATTVDPGLMRDVGVLAETWMMDAFCEWEKPYGIREVEFLALIERVIDRAQWAPCHLRCSPGLLLAAA